MWKLRTKTVPVTIAAVGTAKNGLDQNIQFLTSHPSIIQLQKITLISTTHIIREMLG
jgi:hypothetical protein